MTGLTPVYMPDTSALLTLPRPFAYYSAILFSRNLLFLWLIHLNIFLGFNKVYITLSY